MSQTKAIPGKVRVTLTIRAPGYRAYTVPGEIVSMGFKQDVVEVAPVDKEWRRWAPKPESQRTLFEGRMRGRANDMSRSFEAFRRRIAGSFRFGLAVDDGEEIVGRARKGEIASATSDLDNVLTWTAVFWLEEKADESASAEDD